MVLRPLVHGPGAERVLVRAREHEHWRVHGRRTQTRETVERPGQPEIEQDAVGRVLVEPRDGR